MNQGYFVHETAIVDGDCIIGDGTKIWHFSHIMSNCVIGDKCNIGQNVVVSPGVVLGSNVKVQNNVSIYTGVICDDDVFLGPSMVFTAPIIPKNWCLLFSYYIKNATWSKFLENVRRMIRQIPGKKFGANIINLLVKYRTWGKLKQLG
jgi:NDP-sugar pyrophosphorylase family protein